MIRQSLFYIFSLNQFFSNDISTNPRYDNLFVLNYRRRNFFPVISSFFKKNLVFTSLGLFLKMFIKPKSFIRNKALYLLTASFFRKIIIFGGLKFFIFIVKRKPLFLQEFISNLYLPSSSIYKNPFSDDIFFEKEYTNRFFITNFLFLNNKNFSFQKTRLRGRLKRRIFKRLVKINNVLD
jgi:hypothetical protein